jgi:hypothetical protein
MNWFCSSYRERVGGSFLDAPKSRSFFYCTAVLRIRDVYPGSEFFHPGSRIHCQKIPYPDLHLSIFDPKIVFKHSQIRSRMFIPDPTSGIFIFYPSRIRIQGRKRPDHGSGSATMLYSVLVSCLPVEWEWVAAFSYTGTLYICRYVEAGNSVI